MANYQENIGMSYLGEGNSIGHEDPVNSIWNDQEDYMYYQSTSSSFDGYGDTNYNSKSQFLNMDITLELSANPLGDTLPSFSSIRPTFKNSSVDHETQNIVVNGQNGPLFESSVNSAENQTTDFYGHNSGIEFGPEPTNIVEQLPGHSSWDNGYTVPVENQTTDFHGYNSSIGSTLETTDYLNDAIPGHSSWNSSYLYPLNNQTTNIDDHTRSSIALAPGTTNYLRNAVGPSKSISSGIQVYNHTSNSLNNSMRSLVISGNSNYELRPETIMCNPGTSSHEVNPLDEPVIPMTRQRLPTYVYNTYTDEQKNERRRRQHKRSSQKHYKKKKEEMNQLKREDESLKISIADKKSKKATLEKKIDIMKHYLQKI